MQMWASSTTVGIITLLLVSAGHIAGHITLFISENWSHCWLHHFIYIRKLVALLVTWYGQLTSHFTLHFSACRWGPREICVGDSKVMLYNVQTQVSSRHWRWSTGWNIQWGWGWGYGLRSSHCSLGSKTGTCSDCGNIFLAAEVMSMAAATGPIPGPEEVIMKKAALVTVPVQHIYISSCK